MDKESFYSRMTMEETRELMDNDLAKSLLDLYMAHRNKENATKLEEIQITLVAMLGILFAYNNYGITVAIGNAITLIGRSMLGISMDEIGGNWRDDLDLDD